MTLDELIARLKQLRKNYPQLASEIVSMIVRNENSIVGKVEMYTRDGVPNSIVIEDWRR